MEVAGVGDFERDQAFTCSAWVKVPNEKASGAMVARMDEANDFRGWDMWLDQGRPGMHIVHKWPGDALKVVGKNPLKTDKWQYVTVAYDGSGRAEGAKVYVDGVAQEIEVAANTLQNSIRTTVPLKLAQRNSSSRVDGLALQDLRLYNRQLAPGEVAQLASATRAAYLVAKPAEGRSPSELEELYGWWLDAVDPTYQQSMAQNANSMPAKRPLSLARPLPTSRRKKPTRRWPMSSIAAITTSAATRSRPTRPTSCPRSRPSFRVTAWGMPSGCCAPTIR